MHRIESKRCIIRSFQSEDIETFMIYRNDEEWMRYQGFKGRTKKEYEEALLSESSIDRGMQLAVIEKDMDELIGDIYVKKDDKDFWMGYTISPLHARQGYAYEVAISLISWIREEGGEKIYAAAHSENIASVKLLEKLGFTYLEKDEYGDDIYLLKL